MNSNTEFLPIREVENGMADQIARDLLKCWAEHDGKINDTLANFAPYTLLFDGTASYRALPNILYGGLEAKALKQFGPNLLRNTPEAFFTRDYIEACARTFSRTMSTGKPVFEQKRCQRALLEGGQPVLYKSLTLPFCAANGATFLLTYSFDLSHPSRQAEHEEAGQRRFHRSLGSTDFRSQGYLAH